MTCDSYFEVVSNLEVLLELKLFKIQVFQFVSERYSLKIANFKCFEIRIVPI